MIKTGSEVDVYIFRVFLKIISSERRNCLEFNV